MCRLLSQYKKKATEPHAELTPAILLLLLLLKNVDFEFLICYRPFARCLIQEHLLAPNSYFQERSGAREGPEASKCFPLHSYESQGKPGNKTSQIYI